MSCQDTRLRAGAYITDGTALYEVRRVRTGGPGVKITIEDCSTLAPRELDMLSLRKFRLVRSADRSGGRVMHDGCPGSK
jgi:hypothetical protein